MKLQAPSFEGLAINNRSVRHHELTFATTDHNVPTDSRIEIKDPIAKTQSFDTPRKL